MELKARQVAAGLVNKGFTEVAGRSDRHFRLDLDGRKTGVRTMISHGERDLGTRYLHSMARQLSLTDAELIDLVRCPLSSKELVALLRDRQRLS